MNQVFQSKSPSSVGVAENIAPRSHVYRSAVSNSEQPGKIFYNLWGDSDLANWVILANGSDGELLVGRYFGATTLFRRVVLGSDSIQAPRRIFWSGPEPQSGATPRL